MHRNMIVLHCSVTIAKPAYSGPGVHLATMLPITHYRVVPTKHHAFRAGNMQLYNIHYYHSCTTLHTVIHTWKIALLAFRCFRAIR
jgi:hypothetical protein